MNDITVLTSSAVVRPAMSAALVNSGSISAIAERER